MPRSKKDYSKTVIYEICNSDRSLKYVGSTTNLVQRRAEHKYSANNPNSHHYFVNLYNVIRNNGGWENWSMKPVECYPCKNKTEAEIRERYWCDQLQANVNKVRPNITDEERALDRERKTTCECGVTHLTKNRFHHVTSKRHINFLLAQTTQTET